MGRLKKNSDFEEASPLTAGVHWLKSKENVKQHVYFKEDGYVLVCDEDIRDIIFNPDKYSKPVVKRFITNVRKYLLVDIGYYTKKEFKSLTNEDFDRILDDPNNWLYEMI